MKIVDVNLTHKDIEQGIIEKKRYLLGGVAYIKTTSGKQIWFDEQGHCIRRLLPDGTETIQAFHRNGCIKYEHKVGKSEAWYNELGQKIRKINKETNIEQFWTYDEKHHLSRWYDTRGLERRFVCDETGKVIKWYCNEALMSWYKETNRKFYSDFAGLIS